MYAFWKLVTYFKNTILLNLNLFPIKEYMTILTAIQAEAAALGLIIDPKVIITDFELAAIKAFNSFFLKHKWKFVYLILIRLFLKTLKNKGLVESYLNDPKLQEWFERVFTLALIPLDSVETQFEIL